MSKPFHKNELVARIRAIVRRSQGHAQSLITTGALVVNLDSKIVTVHDSRINLTNKEYQILELLSLRRGSTLTKEVLLDSLYGGLDEPNAKTIDVFICELRKKLVTVSRGHNFIETVWGSGIRCPTGSDRPLRHELTRKRLVRSPSFPRCKNGNGYSSPPSGSFPDAYETARRRCTAPAVCVSGRPGNC